MQALEKQQRREREMEKKSKSIRGMLRRDILAKLREARIFNDYEIAHGQTPYDLVLTYHAPEPRSVDPGGWFVTRPGYKLKESRHWSDNGGVRFMETLGGGVEDAWAFIEGRGLKRDDFVRSPFAQGRAKAFVHKEALRRAYERAGIA